MLVGGVGGAERPSFPSFLLFFFPPFFPHISVYWIGLRYSNSCLVDWDLGHLISFHFILPTAPAFARAPISTHISCFHCNKIILYFCLLPLAYNY